MGVYCVITLKGGERVLEVMTRDEIDRVRARSKAAQSGPWVTDFPMMCRKTVLRRVAHYIPKSSERFTEVLEREIERDLAIDVTAASTAASSSIADDVMRRAHAVGTDDDGVVTPPPADSRPGREPGDDAEEEEA
jgi:recombination protein RecT